MSHHHNHHHHEVENVSSVKIFWVTLFNALITLTEFIGGIISGSLSLVSDAVHNLSDTIAIALSYFALKISKKEKNKQKTFGYRRAQILAAFINSSALIVISAFLIWEAIKRFSHPSPIKGTLMIAVAAIGLVSNLISVLLLEKDSHHNMNIKSSYLHLVGDTLSSVGVLIGGIAIKLWNFTIIDPIITLLVALYIIKETWHIFKKSVDILMQSSADLDYDKIKSDIENIEEVKNIHHVHTWLTDEKTIYFEAHIDLKDMMISEAEKVYEKISHLLKEHYNVHHITLQFETGRCEDKKMF